MQKRSLLLPFLLAAILFAASASYANSKMLFCLPGFPGTTTQAQPYVDKMLRYLEQKLSWPAGSTTGLYLPDGDAGAAELVKTKPKIALVGPSIYAGHKKELKMKVIAKVEVNGRGDQTYSVITNKQGPGTLQELVGKNVEGAIVHDEKYVYNVLLDGKLPSGGLHLKSEARPLRALRNVARGKAEAAIVDDEVVGHLSELSFANDLRVVYTSKKVPAPMVVVMGAANGEVANLKEVLIGMCGKPESAELCKTLTITSIKSADDSNYKELLRAYNR